MHRRNALASICDVLQLLLIDMVQQQRHVCLSCGCRKHGAGKAQSCVQDACIQWLNALAHICSSSSTMCACHLAGAGMVLT